MKWFNHPRVFWTAERRQWADYDMDTYRLSLRQRWALALRDPIYVGLWFGLISIVGGALLATLL